MGTDVGVNVSVANPATSALDQRYLITHAPTTSGGAGMPKWLLPLGMVLVAAVLIIKLIRGPFNETK